LIADFAGLLLEIVDRLFEIADLLITGGQLFLISFTRLALLGCLLLELF